MIFICLELSVHICLAGGLLTHRHRADIIQVAGCFNSMLTHHVCGIRNEYCILVLTPPAPTVILVILTVYPESHRGSAGLQCGSLAPRWG